MNGKIEVGFHGLIILIASHILLNLMPTLLPVYKWVMIAGMAAILVMDFYFFAAGKFSRLKYSRLALIYMFSLLLIVFITFYLTKIVVLTDAYGSVFYFIGHFPVISVTFSFLSVSFPIYRVPVLTAFQHAHSKNKKKRRAPLSAFPFSLIFHIRQDIQINFPRYLLAGFEIFGMNKGS